jgi:hypothetical protein
VRIPRIYPDTSIFGGCFDEEFEHIVHYDKIRMFNAVNLKEGYPPIDIRSPREVVP